MSHKATKIGVTSLVLAHRVRRPAVTTLGESMQYYKYVDEVMAEPREWEGKKLQVHGYVVPGSIGRKKRLARLDRFDMQRNGKMLRPTTRASSPTRSRTTRKWC